MAAAVVAAGAELGHPVELIFEGQPVEPASALPAAIVGQALDPNLPGVVLEWVTAPEDRRARGVHHTATAVARSIAAFALDVWPTTRTVLDPACGGGVFLLAAGAEIERRSGASRAEIVRCLNGCDVDPLAVATTRAALELWSGSSVGDHQVMVGDALVCSLPAVDLVVGNPPFLAQLRGATARSGSRREQLRARWPDVGGYVDEAALFLLAGLEAAPDGCVAMIQPMSLLSNRDAEPVRRRCGERGGLAGLWIDGERMFVADVDVCAPVLAPTSAREVPRRVGGAGRSISAASRPPDAASWGPLVADVFGVPRITRRSSGADPLGSVARCTAGFRSQFYGLRDAVRDGGDTGNPLITSGLIDPLGVAWGERTCRFDGRRWQRPLVAIDRVDPEIRDWIEARLRPKIVVATQTRIVEAAVDLEGTWVPCTPVIVIEPHADSPSLWHLAAALSAPPVSAWLAAAAAGSALTPGAVRPTASRLAAIPLPDAGPAWDEAARRCRLAAESGDRESVIAAADAGCAAYAFGGDAALMEWWTSRLPAGLRPGGK